MSLAIVLLGGGAIGLALRQEPPEQEDAEKGESERTVTEDQVPKAALDALKKLAAGAKFTEFAEEVEHGHTFYEGSWKSADGNVDAVVTPSGDLVALEEVIPADKVASAAREAVHKHAGKDTKLMIEKKTMILYEAHWTKDGKEQEMIVTPDGRRYYEDAASGGKHDEDDDDDKGKGEDEDNDDKDDD
jgi:uncharacterized membrane protein YkoI